MEVKELIAQSHRGPVAWQKFGVEYCLAGQYGMRPIILSTSPRGELRSLCSKTGLLIRSSPNHPDMQRIAAGYNSLPLLVDVEYTLKKCGDFIQGFSGDEMQRGVPELLAEIRTLQEKLKAITIC